MNYLDRYGNYYEGDRISIEDIEVSPRPSSRHDHVNGEWVERGKTKDDLIAELQAIETAELMPRKTREIQIQLMEFLAVQQGITPEQLALNPAYAGMKEIDAICVALRAQIRALS
jgi:hypothetical protein